MSKVKITGSTFNCKELLKAEGGKWEAETKSWELEAAAWEKIIATNPRSLTDGCYILGTQAPVPSTSITPAAPAAPQQSEQWEINNQIWVRAEDGNGYQLQSFAGVDVSNRNPPLSREEYIFLCGAKFEGDARTSALYPATFQFSPTTGKPLSIGQKMVADVPWLAPYGELQTESLTTPKGLRATHQQFALSANFGKQGRSLAEPSNGLFQFFVTRAGLHNPCVVAIDPSKGSLWLMLPGAGAWVGCTAQAGSIMLPACSLAREAWSMWGDTLNTSACFFVPTDYGIALVMLNVLARSYQVQMLTNGRCLSGPAQLDKTFWFLTEAPQTDANAPKQAALISISASPKPRVIGQMTLPADRAELCNKAITLPVTDERSATWVLPAGQLILHQNAGTTPVAEFSLWHPQRTATAKFGAPYYSKDGRFWQLFFDATVQRYVYTRLGTGESEHQHCDAPRLSCGFKAFAWDLELSEPPWVAPSEAHEAGVDDVVFPLLEMKSRKIIIGITVEDTRALSEVVEDVGAQTAKKAAKLETFGDTRQTLARIAIRNPWDARLFVYNGHLHFYHPDLHDILSFEL